MLRVCLAAILFVLAACGDDSAAGGADGALCAPSPMPVLNGSATTKDPSVVSINELYRDPCARAGVPQCTGTLVTPTMVLTAAHCISEGGIDVMGVVVGDNADLGTGTPGQGLDGVLFSIVSAHVHPAYDEATLANDVAVLELAEAVSQPVKAVNTQPLEQTIVGGAGRVVGFGEAEQAPAFIKREGTVMLSALDPTELEYVPGPSMTCSGDSGGPLLVTSDIERVVGVTSRGDIDCELRGVAIRVDAVWDFLGPVVAP